MFLNNSCYKLKIGKIRAVSNPFLVLSRNHLQTFPVKVYIFQLTYFLVSRYFKYSKNITTN